VAPPFIASDVQTCWHLSTADYGTAPNHQAPVPRSRRFVLALFPLSSTFSLPSFPPLLALVRLPASQFLPWIFTGLLQRPPHEMLPSGPSLNCSLCVTQRRGIPCRVSRPRKWCISFSLGFGSLLPPRIKASLLNLKVSRRGWEKIYPSVH